MPSTADEFLTRNLKEVKKLEQQEQA